MVFNIAVFGSCVSRDIFYSQINPNYKDYFNVVLSSQRESLISLMQKPVKFNIKDLKIQPKTQVNNSRTRFLKEDLNKSFLNGLNSEIDILILDNYFEFRFGILNIDNNHIITNNDWDLPETDFYKNLKIKNPLNISADTDEYLSLWTENVDLFFNYLNTHCPKTKIVLNSARLGYNLLKKDKTVECRKDFKINSKESNKYIKIFDKYIAKNYDVKVLKFNKKVLLDENHIWGIGQVHYENSFYEKRLMDLIKIGNNESFISKIRKTVNR